MTNAKLHVDVWEERDRLHIHLIYTDSTGDEMTIGEWWDDDARQMFEDGFFDCQRLEDSIIEYTQQHGMLNHFVYGSGEHGCLYNNGPHLAWLRKDAVNALADTFSLGRGRKSRLNRDGYLELKSARDGAAYCEITPCSCAKPEEHEGE